MGPATVKTVRTVLSHALGYAYDCGLVGRNVAERAKPPMQPFRTIEKSHVWGAAQMGRFLDEVAGHRLEAAWNVAAMTGLRRGELLGLRWSDVDLESRRLWVRRALVCSRGGVIETTPKSGRERVVDLDRATGDSLLEHRRRQQLEKNDWGELYLDNGFVFAQENGLPINPTKVSETFGTIAANAGLPHIRFHDLRHSHAPIAIQAGVPITVVSERLGHSSPWFTWRQYGHLLDEAQAEAAETVADAVRGGRVERGTERDPELSVLLATPAPRSRPG